MSATSPLSAAQLSQLESWWTTAGGSAAAAPQAAAIVAGEDASFNPSATYQEADGSTSYGLWQINSVHGPELAAAGLTNWQTDPFENAEAAVIVSGGAGDANPNFAGPWAAEFGANSTATANYAAALPVAQSVANTGLPTATGGTTSPTYSQNPFQQWFTQLLTGNAGTALVGGGNVGVTQSGGLSSGGIFGALQTTWSAWWSAHPAVLVVAGVVALVIAWALISGGGTNVTLDEGAK